MSVQPIKHHYKNASSSYESNSKISEAINRARCLVQVGTIPTEPGLNDVGSRGGRVDVRVLVANEYSDVNDALRGCLTRSTEEPIVVYLAEYDEVTELLALRAGAVDVLRADMTVRVMAERISRAVTLFVNTERVEEGNMTPASNRPPALKLDDGTLIAELLGQTVQLTKMELSVLKVLNENSYRLVSREELMEAVGTNTSRSDRRAVDTQVKRLRRKFGEVGFGPEIIKTVYGVGYRLNTESVVSKNLSPH
ncbi:winged helix-turn-helix domain-containing protein [uncultured Roseovarius sp.]|uniref:winged helix-turn-helix domain-containing protein n=1 Tax=uncultured Roseovarius sp. TaxID=293344 RepID=UPI0025E9FE9A|nr:winged helix-turn-helix domain-containing protein [uncultured Roseovarius sp.]